MAKGQAEIAIRAQEMANWLTRPGVLPTNAQKLSGKEAFGSMAGKTGIVFFQDYWGSNEQGDHIDLWNGSRLTDWTSLVRIQGGIHIPGVWSDYKKAESVWFWAMT
ncbi:T6SS effector amidase Tae4 family protein [Noviherbaspirillum aerium]|uniref:T6SS effector amidase Tae4 family protein n=1 Tax=Noviherbaspirillum aerium TaxID=2588497 RepID=UPI001CEF7B15|nr:T6SS effector amidase Tae4 family protein [Noviherbaspirillum aerium]